jgi:hypothetical protein
MDLKGRGWEVVEWFHLVYDRDKWWAVTNFWVSLRAVNFF